MFKRYIFIISSLILIFVVSGCNGASSDSRENIDAGLALIENGDLEDALSSFEGALSSGEDVRDAYRGMGIANLRLGDYQSAIDSFKSALDNTGIFPDATDYDINYYLADAYIKNESYIDAIVIYTNILNLKKNDEDAYYLRGIARIKNGDYDSAMSDFNKSIDLAGDDYDRIILVYEILVENGYNDEARAFLENKESEYSSKMSEYQKGRFAYYLGDYDTAADYLEIARSSTSEDAGEAALLLGSVSQQKGEYEYALSVYETYQASNGDGAEFYNQMGLCALAMDNIDEAITYFESGLKMDDNSIKQDLSWNMMVAYERKGEFGTARDLLKQYLDSYPMDEKAQKEYTFLSTR